MLIVIRHRKLNIERIQVAKIDNNIITYFRKHKGKKKKWPFYIKKYFIICHIIKCTVLLSCYFMSLIVVIQIYMLMLFI